VSILDGGFRIGSTRTRTRPHGNLLVLKVAVILAFGVLTARLASMQLVHGSDYARRAEQNHIRAENILPPRGLVLARDGEPLVENVGVYTAMLIPEFLPDEAERRQGIYLWVETHLGVPALQVQAMVQEAEDDRRADRAIPIQQYLTKEQALMLEESSADMPGLSLATTPGRRYIAGEAFSHILGYIGPQSPGEAKQLGEQGYAPNEPVGKDGVEARYEKELRGQAGYSANEQDAEGHLVDVLESKDPVPGNNLRLSIDLDLQTYVTQLLKDSMGEARQAAAVVMSAKTGELYALASVPTYDNNIFGERGKHEAEYERLSKDSRKPFLNQALWPATPGSVFKLITASAALEEGLVTPQTWRDVDSSVLWVKGENGQLYPLVDWRAHGSINLYGAIAWSSNIYFYMASCGILGESKGLAKNAEESAVTLGYYARGFGLGQATGIDLGGETDGIIPGPEYKRRVHTGPQFDPSEREWWYGDTCSMGIGQQDDQATPLQIARMTAAVANGGTLLTPHLMADVTSASGEVVRRASVEAKSVPVRPEHLAVIREGMRQSVADGAGKLAQQPGVQIAGKTGTAEFKVGGITREHAWFTGFAPFDDPEVVVTVYFDLGWGGDKAAPVAGKIMKYFMDNVKQ
jgi:penicillin-binding protein 2